MQQISRYFIQRDMEATEKQKQKGESVIVKKRHEFQQTISELRGKINTLDEGFLMRLGTALELRNCIFSEEISSLVLVISTAAIATKKPQMARQQEINGNAYLRVEELAEFIYEYKGQITLKMAEPEIVGWTSKVWDKLVYSSCFRNYIDLMVLYFFIGDSLLQKQKELKRLSKLLLVSFSKIKSISEDTLTLTIFILNQFIRQCDKFKACFDLKVRLKILNILYLSKVNDNSPEHIQRVKQALQQFINNYLQHFIELMGKMEESGISNEEEFIWDRLFVTVLRTFHHIEALNLISRRLLIDMLHFRIDMQTVKLLIRQLQVNNESSPLQKWKQIFSLLDATVKIYDQPRSAFVFLTSKSYLKMPLQAGKNFLLKIHIKNHWKTYEEQKFLFMIQDKNKKEELWITSINENQENLKIILLKVYEKNIIEQTQQIIKWNQNTTSVFLITFTPEEIKVQVDSDLKNTVSIYRFMSQPHYLTIGDGDCTLGTSIKSFFSLSIAAESQSQSDLICPIFELNNKALESKGLRKKAIPSFVQIFKALGDLDVYLLIVSHALRRMKTDPLVTDMLRLSLSLMENFVLVKHVQQLQLKSKEREQRLNAILCLCWQCSHQTKNALAVLELLRVLSIRGIPNPEDELQVLCNFVFWKQFQWQYQRLIILKIKQIFIRYRFHDCYLKPVHKYCKRIMMEVVLYYREEDVLLSADEKEQILRIHYQFISLIQDQMLNQIKMNKEMDLVSEYLQFLIKVCSLTIARKAYHGIETFDLTLSIEISMLARRIGQELSVWTEKEDKLYKLIKGILDVCCLYNSEQYYFFEKQLMIYMGDQGFIEQNESLIKANLYFLAYKLVSLRPHLLFRMAELDETGVPEITCIGWQREFFDKLVLPAEDGSFVFQHKTDKLVNCLQIFERLPLKYMSPEQNQLLFKIYLGNQLMFPMIDYKLSTHFWKILGIEGVVLTLKSQVCGKEMKKSKIESQVTAASKVESSSCHHLDLVSKKILCILIACEQLSSIEGLGVLNLMNFTGSLEKSEQFRLVVSHFVLKNLIEKTKKMMSSTHQSEIPLRSCIDVSMSIDSSNNRLSTGQQSLEVTREEYTKCIQYFLTQITVKDIMQAKGITSIEEGNGHLENCKIQLNIMMNHLCNHQNNSMNELKKYYQFLEVQIMPLSKYYLELYNILPVHVEERSIRRKMSKHFQFPSFDLKEETKTMYSSFMDERNENFLKVEKVWNKIEERNKYFWSTFLPKETVYNLHQATGPFNQKYLLKKNNKKQKLQLPRMHRTSLIKSNSIMSQKFQFCETESVSSMFEDAHLYRKQATSYINLQNQPSSRDGRINKFNVLLITTSKIYQGTLVVTPKKITFSENEVINQSLYKKIYAIDFEKRNEDECILEHYQFEQQLSPKCLAIVKRYLFHDIALQIQTKNRSYFFSFVKRDHRQACLIILQKFIKVIKRQKITEEVKFLNERWENGQISNYSYLMNLNNIAGRSFNDLSQYYVFPWTVINFTDPLNLEFFQKQQNFRDLSLPVGKLNRSKWENIKKNYERIKKDNIPGIKPFLYGSFYSNPAIVSNFLIRINPFASQHFELQSKQFDLPDRLFYSVVDCFKSLTLSSSDFKELIPEFYFFPEFLKNRNEYNLGLRQNKDIVNNVALPYWAHDEYQFVYRMRKFLQCNQVTRNLHGWIDLIFGVYSKKQYAIRADNLFLDQLYIDSYQAQYREKNKDFMMYFKQFGQVPVPIFNLNHTPCKFFENSLNLLRHPSNRVDEFIFSNSIGKIIQIYFTSKFTFFLFDKQLRIYSEQKFSEKDFLSVSGDFEGGSVRLWQILDEKDKKHHCVLIHKKKTHTLVGYEIKTTLFNKYTVEGGEALQFKHRIQSFTTYDNMLICSEGKNVYIYKNIQEEIEEEYSTINFSLIQNIGKTKFLLAIGYQFTQHKSKVIFLGSTQKGIIVSIDEEAKVYIVQIHSGVPNIYNYFEIRSLCFEQTISEIILHPHGFIIVRTDRERLLMFTLLGDKVVDHILHFKKHSNNAFTEKMLSMTIWNPQFTELIVGTNLGNLWKIDPFAIRRCEEVEETQIWIERMHLNRQGFRKEGILKVATNRIGRHSLTLAYGENNKLYTLKSERWDEARKAVMCKKKLK